MAVSVPGWRGLRLLNLSTCGAPFLDLSHPSLPSPPTCRPPAPPWPACWGRGFAGEEPVFGEPRAGSPAWAERPHQVSALHQHCASRMLCAKRRRVAIELCRLADTTVQLCSSERIWVRDRGWNGPRRWQEAEFMRRGRYPSKGGGNRVACHLSLLGIRVAESLPGCGCTRAPKRGEPEKEKSQGEGHETPGGHSGLETQLPQRWKFSSCPQG